MKQFFSPNIDGKGRVMRALMALVLLVGGGFACLYSVPLGIVLLIAGLFGVFEAARSWCFLRACGIRTRL